MRRIMIIIMIIYLFLSIIYTLRNVGNAATDSLEILNYLTISNLQILRDDSVAKRGEKYLS